MVLDFVHPQYQNKPTLVYFISFWRPFQNQSKRCILKKRHTSMFRRVLQRRCPGSPKASLLLLIGKLDLCMRALAHLRFTNHFLDLILRENPSNKKGTQGGPHNWRNKIPLLPSGEGWVGVVAGRFRRAAKIRRSSKKRRPLEECLRRRAQGASGSSTHFSSERAKSPTSSFLKWPKPKT